MLLIIEPERINTINKMSIVELAIPNSDNLQNEANDMDNILKDDFDNTDVLNNSSKIKAAIDTFDVVTTEIKSDKIVNDNLSIEKPESVNTAVLNDEQLNHHTTNNVTELEYKPSNNGDTDIATGENNVHACTIKNKHEVDNINNISTNECTDKPVCNGSFISTDDLSNDISTKNSASKDTCETATLAEDNLLETYPNNTLEEKSSASVEISTDNATPAGEADKIENRDDKIENVVLNQIDEAMNVEILNDSEAEKKEDNNEHLVEYPGIPDVSTDHLNAENTMGASKGMFSQIKEMKSLHAEINFTSKEKSAATFEVSTDNETFAEKADKNKNEEDRNENMLSNETHQAMVVEADENIEKSQRNYVINNIVKIDNSKDPATDKNVNTELHEVMDIGGTEAEIIEQRPNSNLTPVQSIEVVERNDCVKIDDDTIIDKSTDPTTEKIVNTELHEAMDVDGTEAEIIEQPPNSNLTPVQSIEEVERNDCVKIDDETIQTAEMKTDTKVNEAMDLDHTEILKLSDSNNVSVENVENTERNYVIDSVNREEDKHLTEKNSNKEVNKSINISETETVKQHSDSNIIPPVENNMTNTITENSVASESSLDEKMISKENKTDLIKIGQQLEINKTPVNPYNTQSDEIKSISDDDTISKEVSVNLTNDKDSDNEVTVVEQKINEKNDEDPFDQVLKNSLTNESNVTKPINKKSSLANNLDIFSDEEDENRKAIDNKKRKTHKMGQRNKECVSLMDDDDDIMVIDDDNNSKADNNNEIELVANNCTRPEVPETESPKKPKTVVDEPNTDVTVADIVTPTEKTGPTLKDNESEVKPLVAKNFLKNFKSKMSEMTRADLEDFCLIKIVEGVIDRSSLSEIKSKLKTMTQNVEEWRKKHIVLNKQNRDLQIVLRTIQEEQKKKSDEAITPLKITRSVGMQVLMGENKTENSMRARNQKRFNGANQSNQIKNNQTSQKQQAKNTKTPIPTPRLVPASPTKPSPPIVVPLLQLQNSTITSNSGPTKTNSPNVTKPTPPKKSAEKRPLNDAIDLTDDDPTPPAKKAPVRLVPSQQLMAPGRSSIVNNGKTPPSPRQVYIPIGSQTVRPQPIYRAPTTQGVRARGPSPGTIIRTNSSPVVRSTVQRNPHKHPAPLPQAFSQPQPPNWKALPPAPDLKISKIENGIVVSWKIDGYQESSYEEIVSYQLYAYQETAAPASTLLWNKIGDIKALPLPMACTLTQFIAGYKYYFAVRAVDIRSRIGPFSLPGSILLLNK